MATHPITSRFRKLAAGVLFLAFLAAVTRFVLGADLNVTATVVDGQLIVTGYTTPNSTMYLTDTIGNAVIASQTSSATGTFSFDITPFSPGSYVLAVTSFDPNLEETAPYELSFSIGAKEVRRFESLTLPPTVRTNKTIYDYNEDIQIEIYGRPNATANLEIDGPNPYFNTYTLGPTGQRTIALPAIDFAGGTYTMTAYFNPARPSTEKTYTVLAVPTNTPTPTQTPTPSLTPTPTLTPTITLTPSPTPTFSPTPTLTPSLTPTPTITNTPTPGPSATPAPAPTDTPAPTPTYTPVPFIPSPTPTCEERYGKLCFFDQDESRTIELTEITAAISQFEQSLFVSVQEGAVDRFDINNDRVVNGLDLAMLLSAVADSTEGFLGIVRIRAKPVNIDTYSPQCTNICREVERAMAADFDEVTFLERRAPLFASISLLFLLPFIRFQHVRFAKIRIYRNRGFAWLTVLYYVTIVSIIGMLLYREYRITRQLAFLQSQTSTVYAEEGDLVTYRFLITSEQPLSALELYVKFNQDALEIEKVNTQDSFANIITHIRTSQKRGVLFVLGGVTSNTFTPRQELFLEVTFRKIGGDTEDPSVSVLPDTAAYPPKATSAEQAYLPEIRVVKVGSEPGER